MKKIELEFIVRCSPSVLFYRVSTASGLSEWFADNVKVSGNQYTFEWDGYGQVAEVTSKKDTEHIRFDWVEEGEYFEFKISQDELTNDVSLYIVDFADDDDEAIEVQSLWETQILKLKQMIGS